MRRTRYDDPTIAVMLDPQDPRHAARFAQALRTHPRFAGHIYALEPSAAPRPGALAIPTPTAGTQALLDRLFDIHATVGLDAILPTRPDEIPALAANAPALAALGIGTFLPTPAQLARTVPALLPALARDIGVRGPRASSVTAIHAALLGDGEGSLHGAVVRRLDDGASQRASGPLMALLARFAAATWWCGPCEVRLTRDLDGVFRLQAVTPGLPDWVCRGDGRSYAWAWAMLARGSQFETHGTQPCTAPRGGNRFRTIPPRGIARAQRLTA